MSIKNEIVRWYVLLFKADSSENKRMYQGEFFLFDCLRHVCVCFFKKKNYIWSGVNIPHLYYHL
jgi:hypothetical protein